MYNMNGVVDEKINEWELAFRAAKKISEEDPKDRFSAGYAAALGWVLKNFKGEMENV